MKSLFQKSSINILHWTHGMLVLFFFCAPVHAQMIPFQSTSNRPVISQPISNSISGSSNSNIVGEYKPYHPNVYVPFGDETPSSGNPLNNNGSGGSGDPNDDVGIPGWADTPSEPLPIGDTAPLFLFAAAMIAIIFIKQRRKQLQTQSTNTSNNNDNSDSMHTTRHISSNRFQKLFLLLAFVCFVGQANADRTIYFRPSTTRFESINSNYADIGCWTYNGNDNVYILLELHQSGWNTINGDKREYVFRDPDMVVGGKAIMGSTASRFIDINVPDGYTGIVAYRWHPSSNGYNINKKNIQSSTYKTGETRYPDRIMHSIPCTDQSGHWPKGSPIQIPSDKNLLVVPEGQMGSTTMQHYWAYYMPAKSNVQIYFANTNGWSNVQLLTNKDIYTRSTNLTTIDNTRLCYKSFSNSTEYAYNRYGFVGNQTSKHEGQVGVEPVSQIEIVPLETAENSRIATLRTTYDNYTQVIEEQPLGIDATSGISLFIPEETVNNTAVEKKTLNDWENLNHTLTIKNYIYNPQTKSFDNSNAGGYIEYFTHKLTGATTTQRIPEGNGYITIDALSGSTTAAYTGSTTLIAHPKEGYKFHGWYDKDGTLLYEEAEFPWYKVQNYDNEVHARFVPNDVKHFKYRVQTCASGQEFNTTSFDATGGSINVTATDGQSVTISKANGNDNEYQKLYHQDDTQITCTATPNSGYVFVGWWNNKNGQILTNPWIDKAVNMNDYVTARFASVDNICEQTITVSGLGSATITRYLDQASTHTITTSKSVTLNTWKGKDVTLVATPKDGYSFVGWYEGQNLVSKKTQYDYTATEARNITAYFAEGTGTTTLTVRAMIYNGTKLVNSLDGGTFTMTHSGGIVYKPINKEDKAVPVLNTPVTFAATANDGYEFIAWFNDTKGQFLENPWIMQNPSNSNTYDKTVTAVFASNKDYAYKQTIKIEGPGTVTANYSYYEDSNKGQRTKTTTFHYNSSFVAWTDKQVTLTAAPLAGYKFDGWYEGGNKITTGVDGNTLTYTADDTHTITAKFKQKVHKLSVSVLNYNPEYDKFEEYGYEYNTVTLTQGGTKLKESYSSFEHTFNDETTVTLTATPEEGEDGYDFVGWYINNEKLTNAGSNSLYTLASDDSNVITINLSGEVAVNAHFAPKKCWLVNLWNNVGGLFTVEYSLDSQFKESQKVKSAYDHYVNTYFAFGTTYIKVIPEPFAGFKYVGFKVGGAGPNSEGIFTYKRVHEEGESKATRVVANFVRTDNQVVYLNLMGANDRIVSGWQTTHNDEYAYYAYANNSCTGKFEWIEMEQHLQDFCYKCTIQGGLFNRVNFVQIRRNSQKQFINDKDEVVDIKLEDNEKDITYIRDSIKIQRIRSGFQPIPTTRYNCYRLNWAWNSSKQANDDAWTTPPTTTGDYRLIYIEQEVASKTKIDTTYIFDEGDRIKKINSGTKLDTVSLHIYNKVSGNVNGVNNPEVILQQWDGTAWVDVERYMVFGPLQTDNTDHIRMPGRKNTVQVVVDKGINAIKAEKADASKDYGCGVWNFVIQQTQDAAGNVTAKLLVDETHRYTGDYYIRTPNADGQYHNFTHPGNIMSYSEYAKNNHDYSHYFIRYVDINEDGTPTAEAGKHPVVKFCVANDYAINLSKEFTNVQNRFEPEEDIYVLNAGDLPADASVRFGWDIRTNRLTRAYIANTTIKNNEYLVVEGTNIGSPQGDDTYFTDNSNWLYSIDLNATKNATAKVKAKMNGQYQYFWGTEQEGASLISGNGESTYPIRLLYDFKDDRFTTIYQPASGTINNDVQLTTPLMIERVHNGEATQIVLNTNKITTVEAGQDKFTQPAYAVMTFLEEVLADASKTHHEKMFYWISFPFDVKISDVFGLGEYGKYWIMEEYDGAQRAAQGLTQSNWKYITKKSTVLNKNVGYVLCLNYSQILQDQLFKSYGSSDQELNSGKLSLYFPSNGVISPADITGEQTRTVPLARYENANTAWNHHNWHIIGVPSFADPKLTDVQTDIPFLYQYWHPDDAYAAVAVGDESQLNFYAMHAYMVQYYGDITWTSVVNTGGSVSKLAAKTDEEADKKIMLRLELQQAGSTIDKTYVQLRNDKGTRGFDMSLDLTKIINAGANIYSIVDNHEMAGNAIPKEETVLPLGVVITAAGEYTFAMPNGTEGMVVELIDYEQGTCTNLLVGDYTVNMPVGTNNTRFALRLKPDKVATSVEDITSGTNDNNVRKLLIDGVLYLQQGTNTYDAQGHAIR